MSQALSDVLYEVYLAHRDAANEPPPLIDQAYTAALADVLLQAVTDVDMGIGLTSAASTAHSRLLPMMLVYQHYVPFDVSRYARSQISQWLAKHYGVAADTINPVILDKARFDANLAEMMPKR